MLLLKRIIKIMIIVTSFCLCIPIVKDIELIRKVDEVISLKKEQKEFEGYIMIPKFGYKSLIKRGSKTLDENLVQLTNFSDKIGKNNIVLAGHNNKYVFNKIYYLTIGDEIILSDFSVDYKYTVNKTKYIYVNDYDELYNENSVTLITCTDNNQERYIVVAKRE